MKHCPECHQMYEDTAKVCSECEAALLDDGGPKEKLQPPEEVTPGEVALAPDDWAALFCGGENRGFLLVPDLNDAGIRSFVLRIDDAEGLEPGIDPLYSMRFPNPATEALYNLGSGATGRNVPCSVWGTKKPAGDAIAVLVHKDDYELAYKAVYGTPSEEKPEEGTSQ